jgi:flagellar L-ring protein precursor FlgH
MKNLTTITTFLLALWPSLALAETPKVPKPPKPATVVPVPRPPPGSLWNEVGARSLVGMNGNARRVGDLITVMIDEQTETELTADTATKRESKMGGKMGAFFGIGKQISKNNSGNLGSGLGYETESGHAYDGKGSTSRAGKLLGRLTCRVVEVLPNGNLKVWGFKQVRSNRETQYLVVEGLARPRDIQADNTITSGLLAEAKIQFNGAGVVGDKQGPGVVHRVMDHAWPF